MGAGYLYFPTSSSSSTLRSDNLPVTDAKTNEACRILALGDSITAGYNLDPSYAYPAKLEALLRENGYPCSVVNA